MESVRFNGMEAIAPMETLEAIAPLDAMSRCNQFILRTIFAWFHVRY